MSSRSLSPVRVAAGAAAAAMLAVLAPAPPAAAGEEVCAHTREDGSCALVLTGVPGVPGVSALRADGPWLEVPGRDPDCRTADGVPVEVVPGDDDGVFHLAPGAETIHCDVTALARAGESAERPGAGPGGSEGTEQAGPAEAGEGRGAPGDAGRAEPPAVPEPVDPSGAAEPAETTEGGGAPEAVEQEEHDGAFGETAAEGSPADPVPSASPAPSSSPSPECLGGAEGHGDAREGQRLSAERSGTCRGTSLAQWPDLGAAAEQAAQLAFVDLADRLGVSVFDLAEWLGVDGVRGLSRRSVDELAAMLGITPQELVERAEEAAAAALAEEVAAATPTGEVPSALAHRGGLFGTPSRLPDTGGGPRTAVLLHGGVLFTATGALILLLSRRRLPS